MKDVGDRMSVCVFSHFNTMPIYFTISISNKAVVEGLGSLTAAPDSKWVSGLLLLVRYMTSSIFS